MTSKKKEPAVPTPAERLGFHYYGSTAYGWQCANTRREVLEQLARAAGSSILRQSAKSESGGLYAITCRVMAPLETAYKISNFMPVGVEFVEVQQSAIINMKGASFQVEPDFFDELHALDAALKVVH